VVTSSHNHTDHLDAETLGPLMRTNPALRLVISEANRQFVAERLGIEPATLAGVEDGATVEVGGFTFTGVMSAHEEPGPQFMGYMIGFGPWSVYHPGDTVLYDGMVERLRHFSINLALLPINGRAPERHVPGNLDGREAAWLAREIGARMVIPCHYEMFEFNTASPDEFVREAERVGQPYRVLRCGERWSNSGL
jgi:L-ascorbate metabolism protein UlaG (beta-lactamase superfamily)